VSGYTLIITGIGTVTVRATQAGNANYATAAPVSVSFAVNPGLPATLSANPLAFGNQYILTLSGQQTIALTNTGSAPLKMGSVILGGASAASFRMSNDSCYGTLVMGASCNIVVRFYPQAAGPVTGAVTIVDNAAGSPLTVTLTGTGVYSAVALSSTSLAFGSQNVPTESAAQTITLTNTGTAMIYLSSVTLGGANPASFAMSNINCYGTLLVNASCTINVRFYPQAPGPATATVNFADNASVIPQTVTVTGTGNVLAPIALLSASGLAFGSQKVGTETGQQTITLTNTGTAPLILTGVALAGANPKSFLMSNINCSGTLAVGASCSIIVRFYPQTLGSLTASVGFTDNASGMPQIVTLTGTGQ
jgi:hypothetical protein